MTARAGTLLLAAGLLLRLPLVALPGLGRDEAAYLYWSRHPEPAYSPLLQGALRIMDWLPGDAAWMFRLPGLAAAAIALLLIRRLTPHAGVASALLLAPWWLLVSSTVHPDAFLLMGLLLMLWSWREGRGLGVSFGLAVSVWAKPSGLVALPAALLFLMDPRLGGRRRRAAAMAMACAACIPVLPILRPEIFQALRQFGSADSSIHWGWRWGMALAALLLLPGPGLLAAAFGRERSAWDRREASLPALFVGAFAFAALFWGQLKINWFLPAVVLFALIPRRRTRMRPPALLASASLSLLLAVGLARPGWTGSVESRFPALAPSYTAQAGGRERGVSSTNSWSQRFSEYQSLEPFAAAVRSSWGDSPAPQWLISDDYGLAAQLLAAWPLPGCRMLLPHDGIFSASWPEEALAPGAPVLVLSVRSGASAAWSSDYWEPARLEWVELPHPVDGEPLFLGRRP